MLWRRSFEAMISKIKDSKHVIAIPKDILTLNRKTNYTIREDATNIYLEIHNNPYTVYKTNTGGLAIKANESLQ